MTNSETLVTSEVGEQLEETTVMGRTVYVSPSEEKAYVEFQGELVSWTNLQAWMTLMEQAKEDVIDGYEATPSPEDRLVEEKQEKVAQSLRQVAYELQNEAQKLDSETRFD